MSLVSILKYLFTNRNVQPPPGVFISAGEGFFLFVQNMLAVTVTMEIRARMQFPDGQTGTQRFNTGPMGPGSNTLTFELPQGVLIGGSLVVTDPPGGVFWGTVYAQLSIATGMTATPVPTQVLLATYVSTRSTVGWPGSIHKAPSESVQQFSGFTASLIAAGFEIQHTFSIPVEVRIVSLRFVLTTSAAAGNRQVSVFLRGGVLTIPYYWAGANFLQPPSTQVGYTVSVGGVLGQDSAVNYQIPFPANLWTAGNDLIQTNTTGLDVNDQYSNIAIRFEPRFGYS